MPPLTLPPELFSLIASFIPLRSAPPTLLSLALGNRLFYSIVRPILYARLILRNEDDAVAVIQRILREPQLGLGVTELHVMSELSVTTRKGRKPFDVLVGIQLLVKERLIPRLVALGIHLLHGWLLPVEFWRSLRNEYPSLHTLDLRNVGQGSHHLWLSGHVIDEINSISGLSVLRLEWTGEGLARTNNLKIINNLPCHASSLRTLYLKSDYQDGSRILSFEFPNLKSLHLDHFASRDHEIPQAIDFFRRHPKLESLSLTNCLDHWFTDKEIGKGFLPNLKHLKARFWEIHKVVAILPQLVSLGFTESYNGQVPYLLRAILPNGLPQLKSLEIQQDIWGWDNYRQEGDLWYETLDGQFRTEQNRKKIPRSFMDGYMHSIVRGAPNLEELGLHGATLGSKSLQTLGPILSELVHMKRFYYCGFATEPKYGNAPPPELHEEMRTKFLSSAEALGIVCTGLESVTSISGKHLPYISAKILRDANGDVARVDQKDGVGMLLSSDKDDPFPSHNNIY